MATNLGFDTHVEALENAPDAGQWYDALISLITRLRSDRNPFGAAALADGQAVSIPVGAIVKWSGAADSVPDGWLKCEGQSVSRTEHAALFAKIGTTFGGSGTTFKLPDYRRRVSIGAGGSRPTGSAGPGTGIGNTGGRETASITVGQMARHSHGLNLSLASAGAHTHKVGETWRRDNNDSLNDGQRLSGRTDRLPSATATLGSATDAMHRHDLTGSVANAGQASPSPVAITSKTVVVTYIIKT